MKRLTAASLLLFVYGIVTSAMQRETPVRNILTWDPSIQSLVDQVSADSISSFIQRLQDFRTRVTLTDSSYAASEWIRQKLASWGYVVEFDSLYVNSTYHGLSGYERNVLGTKPGIVDSSGILLIGAHFDSQSSDINNAPGADDNGSGTAAFLEIARVLRDLPTRYTLRFIGFAAEEVGLLGSKHYAHKAESLAMNIMAMANMDMIGYMEDSLIDYGFSSDRQWCLDLMASAAGLYVDSIVVYNALFCHT